MTPRRVVLVRHGAVDAGGRCYGQRHDPPLSPAGRDQAAALAARVATPAALVTSPARRARETADALPGSPTVDPRWAERNFGDWEGEPWDACWSQVPPGVLADAESYAAFTPPGGEPLEAVAERVAAALDAAAAEVPGEVAGQVPGEVPAGDGAPLVVVTHGGPIRLALRHALGLSLPQTFALDTAPGTSVWLTCWGRRWTLQRLGC